MDNEDNSAKGTADDPTTHPADDAGARAPVHRDGRPQRAGRVQRQLARRRRRERMAGILIAVLGVAVLIVAIIALRHPHNAATAAGSDTHLSTPSQPSSSPNRTAGSTTASSHSPSARAVIGSQPLIVLNQTTTPDLAQQAAARFRHGGWQVSSIQEGYQNDVITTTAYYDPAITGAERAAQALRRQYPTIHRVAERFPQLPAGPVVVVLTTDYSS